MSLVATFVGGMLLAGLPLGFSIWRLKNHLRTCQAQVEVLQSECSHANECDALRAEIDGLRAAGQAAAMQWRARESALQADHAQALQSVMQQAHQAFDASQGNTHELAGAIRDLYGIEMTFERWHADMTVLLAHNRGMHAKNEEFSLIVRQMVMVALNASIESARAGATGRGFGIVANEMRSLSARAEALSMDYRRTLYENDLITTTTFQDMQAGGRMILGAVRGLELTNRRGNEATALSLECA
ncbi:methyl-accepting chemotaxis protein [Pantoea sp. 18069]|uniref:methyl-accepting chemotaxis protein n=1 Tax=Pantoea sp. 18069 TaxID=2681415 RepID=UPI00135968CC|nr:methyl-accepting chemotaxis protein [Pantoea sp. 18069]